MQLSSALATLSHSFQGEARARACSFWGSVVGIGIALGPVVGGLITQAFGWQWAFYVNLPIGLALIALIVRVIDSSKDPDAMRLDMPGVLCFGGALFLTTLALIEGTHLGWTGRPTLSELGGAVLLFVLIVIVERKQMCPMLELLYFLMPTYIGANLAQFSFSAGMLTMLTFIPIFLQRGLGHGAATAGLMMLPMVAPLFFVPRIVTRHLAHRLSGRSILALGLFLVCLGLFWFALVVQDIAYGPMLGGMLLTGIGAGLLNGETTKVGMTVISRERAGMASGVSGTVRFSGLVIGVAALGAILYGKVSAVVTGALVGASAGERLRIVLDITSGNLSGTTSARLEGFNIEALAVRAFASGYQSMFLAAGALSSYGMGRLPKGCYVAAMTTAPTTTTAFTPKEREYIRRELDMFFSSYPTVAEGFQLKIWRGGPQAGQRKLPPAAKTLLERGLMRLDTTSRIPRLFFTDAGLNDLRAMMADPRLANREKFAHIRQELGLNG